MYFLSKKTINGVFYRLAGVAAKFLLILYISKILSLEELGIYNIFTATVAWSVFLLGFEFHWFTTREIVGEDKSKISRFIFSQFIFHLFGMILIPIIVAVVFFLGFIPSSFLLFFVLITLFDQLSQEGTRILIALNEPQISNLIFFVKHGLWIYILFGFMSIGILDINLNIILFFWFIFLLIGFIIVIYNFNKLELLRRDNLKFDFEWIKLGMKTSWPFLLATISSLIIDYSNRYFIDFFLGKESVGIYAFYYGIASIPVTLITSVFVAQNSPRLIEVYKYDGDNVGKKKTILRQFILQNFFIVISFAVVSILSIEWLITFVGKRELAAKVDIFYFMLIYVFIFSLDTVVNSVLYSKRFDKLLLGSSIVGGIVNLILNYFLIPKFGLLGAVYSTIGSVSCMLVIRLSPFINRFIFSKIVKE